MTTRASSTAENSSATTITEIQTSVEQILRDFLLGSLLVDALTVDQFRSLFPQKYRTSPLVGDVYDLLLERRDSVHELVEANIKGYIDALSLPEFVTGLSLSDAVRLLKDIDEKHELELDYEQKRLKELHGRVKSSFSWLDGEGPKALRALASKINLTLAEVLTGHIFETLTDHSRTRCTCKLVLIHMFELFVYA
eukprot:gene11354-3386_t